MPIRLKFEWSEPPKDLSLLVLKELPEEFEIEEWLTSPKEARHKNDFAQVYYHCRYCDGWIAGHPNHERINNMDSFRLSGRSGTVYYCRRCGEEIKFSGMMS